MWTTWKHVFTLNSRSMDQLYIIIIFGGGGYSTLQTIEQICKLKFRFMRFHE